MNITMKTQSRHKDFNILFCTAIQEFFISSKGDEEGRPTIGGFKLASDAIDFAVKRVS